MDFQHHTALDGLPVYQGMYLCGAKALGENRACEVIL